MDREQTKSTTITTTANKNAVICTTIFCFVSFCMWINDGRFNFSIIICCCHLCCWSRFTYGILELCIWSQWELFVSYFKTVHEVKERHRNVCVCVCAHAQDPWERLFIFQTSSYFRIPFSMFKWALVTAWFHSNNSRIIYLIYLCLSFA